MSKVLSDIINVLPLKMKDILQFSGMVYGGELLVDTNRQTKRLNFTIKSVQS